MSIQHDEHTHHGYRPQKDRINTEPISSSKDKEEHKNVYAACQTE
jgi:hypothetical protein